MKEKIKTQKAFIQIPLLIAIIVAVVIVSGVGTGAILHKQGKLASLVANVSQVFKGTEEPLTVESEEVKSQPEQVPELSEEVIATQPSDDETQKRIAELE